MSTEETRSVVAGYVDALRASFTPKATWTIRGDIPVAGTWTGPGEILDGLLAQLTVLALADVVISRSGAGTIAELTALGKASVLIPLPTSAADG